MIIVFRCYFHTHCHTFVTKTFAYSFQFLFHNSYVNAGSAALAYLITQVVLLTVPYMYVFVNSGKWGYLGQNQKTKFQKNFGSLVFDFVPSILHFQILYRTLKKLFLIY